MVSSLSGGGGGGGSDACGAWDARLRAARALLRATHHAQRRYALLIAWASNPPLPAVDDCSKHVSLKKCK